MNGYLQDEVSSFLSGRGAYHLDLPVERHETHGAIVFLAADKAYKLKCTVRLAYMNYSTVLLRHQMCLSGVSGRGKSTLARTPAPAIGAVPGRGRPAQAVIVHHASWHLARGRSAPRTGGHTFTGGAFLGR